MDTITETSPAPGEQGEMTGVVKGAETQAATTEARSFTQDQVNEIIKGRLAEERTKLTNKYERDLEAKVSEALATRDKEFEKQVADRITAALAERDLTDTRRTVQAEYGLTDAQLARLTGGTPEELRADAETLFGALKTRKPPILTPGTPAAPADEPLDLSRMTPAQIREHSDKLMKRR
jgi:hypothetical protein